MGQPLEVNLKSVRVRNTRDFGDVYLALILWRTLGLDEFFPGQGLDSARQDVPWALMVCILTIARFVEPDSELHVEDTWYRRTGLAEMLGVGADKVNDTRLYRTLDVILPLKGKIQIHLKQRIGELFAPDFDLVLYDVTSTYFEGLVEGNPLAQYGYSRDRRGDCKQVCIALVVSRCGLPLGYEVFAGNRHDVVQGRDGRAVLVWEKVEAWRDWAGLSEGCYLLRSNIADWMAEQTLGWDQFKEINIGQLEVKQAGEQDVKVRPQDPQNWQPMNLRFVKLTRAE